MTLAELRRRTGYYPQADAESARRMFERDKDELRRLGVPIDTRELAFGDEIGYLIDRRDYELADIDLTSDEVAALAMAVGMAGSEAMRLTWARLAARAPDPSSLPEIGVRVEVTADVVEALAEPIVTRQSVRFHYQTLGGDASIRTIDPYAVAQRRGAWYVVGWDHGRRALRTFRLDRVTGTIEVVADAGAFDPPSDLDLEAALTDPDARVVDVAVDVEASARWAVQARGGSVSRTAGARESADRLRMQIKDFDVDRELGWLVGLAPRVTVVSPGEVAERVHRALERTIVAHATVTEPIGQPPS